MKIRELIHKQCEVERIINTLVKKFPKENEFRVGYTDPFSVNECRISFDELRDVVDNLIILNKLLDKTIENIDITEFTSIDSCIKG